MTTLAEIRAKLKEQEESKNTTYSGDHVVYPHWNIEEGGDSAQLRFLPDGDESNTFFWVERLQINLKFAGIKGQPNSKPFTVKVPCMENWEPVGSCPILAEIRPWFKDPSLEDTARQYWKKRSYLMQGFVHKDPLKEDDVPENPIRRFILTPQIFELVKASLMDPELEELPTDYKLGLDFFISKTKKGNYADYTTSKWSRRESALTEDELVAIEEHGLFDLKTFLPKKPDAEHLAVIKEMFEASLDGEAYDPDRWATYYRGPGVSAPITPIAENDKKETNGNVKESTKPKVAKKAEPKVDDDIPFVPDPKTPTVETKADNTGNDKAKDILAMIRNRKPA